MDTLLSTAQRALSGDMDAEELKQLAASLLGFAIIAGSFGLKLPQMFKIVSSKSVSGLSPLSFYLDAAVFAISAVYNVLQGNEFSTYGESAVILVQNLVLVAMLWAYAQPRISSAEIATVLLAGAALIGGMLVLPPEHRWILPIATIPSACAARIPQMVSNFANGHTGQLALITYALNFLGSLARVFTTMAKVNDPLLVLGFVVGAVLNGVILLQILAYWSNTSKVMAAEARTRKNKSE